MSTDTTTPTTATFDRDVLGAEGPVLVDFWAQWCGPCLAFKPVVAHVTGARGVTTTYVNVDENPELAQRYAIQSIPALKLFHGGRVVAELTGARSKADLEAWLEEHGA